ncbi:hypothetical protein [Stenotrophomonas maltophilia]|uniref:hypothetical protein n=1 Tax=Stenotrophomonas maltophilia TaxID=40324 RepID=UPI001FA76AF8|nr:hypothetical protein [Stenotrophomonas maltophilia]
MRKILIGAAMSVSMALVGSASAATLNDQLQLSLDVESSCIFSLTEQSLTGRIDNQGGSFVLTSPEGYINVECNQGAAYTIEAGVASGGFVELTGDTTGEKVPAYLFTADPYKGGTPWSTVANGEALSGVATGGPDELTFQFLPNTDATGRRSLNIPKPDTYRANVEITFNY